MISARSTYDGGHFSYRYDANERRVAMERINLKERFVLRSRFT